MKRIKMEQKIVISEDVSLLIWRCHMVKKIPQATFWTVLTKLELFCSSQWSFSNFMLILFIFFPVRKGKIEDLHNLLW